MSKTDELLIENFEKLQKDVVERIKNSGMKINFIATTLKMNRSKLYRRMKCFDFTTSELRSIIKILPPHEQSTS